MRILPALARRLRNGRPRAAVSWSAAALRVVSDRSPGRIDPTGERRFRYDPPAPDAVEHVVLADDAVAVSNEVFQKIEDLGLNGDDLIAAAQLAPVGIEGAVLE